AFGREKTGYQKNLLHLRDAPPSSSRETRQLPDLRQYPDQKERGREMRQRIHLVIFFCLVLRPASHAQSTNDLQSTIRQRTGKEVQWQKDAAAHLGKTKLRVGDAVLKLAVEVKTAFYELQAEQQLVGRLKAINEANATAVELAQRQHEAGNINDLDLANQQATYSQSKLDIAETLASARTDHEKLNRLMGLWGEDTT